jgi:spore germination cell wall hydrolase CwlJ-like protein
MALKTAGPVLKKPSVKPALNKKGPVGVRKTAGSYPQALEDTPVRRSAAVRTYSRPRRPAKKASLFIKAVILRIKRAPLLFPRKAAAGRGVPLMSRKARRAKVINRRIIIAGAVLVPLAVLVIVLAATSGRSSSDPALAASAPSSSAAPGGSAMLAGLDNILPVIPEPSSSPAVNGAVPSATPVATTAPSVAAAPTDKPTDVPKPTKAAPTKAAPTKEPEPTAVPTTEPEPTPKPPNLNELVNYYKVDADKYYNESHYSSNHYEYTEDDVYMLAQVITREAGHEPTEGKLAVGNVIMNRVFCGYWGNTIQSVVTAPGQFSYDAGQQPNSPSINAARDVLKNEHWVVPQDIYFFHSNKTPGENWGGHTYFTQIGGHCFYRESIGRRHNGGDVPPALFDRVFKWPQYGCEPAKRVSRVQHMLRALGYDVQQDGYFGKSTGDALKDFQGKKGLKTDGVAGPTTLKALIKAYGTDKYYDDYVK